MSSCEETLPALFVANVKSAYRDFKDTFSILTFIAIKITVLRLVRQELAPEKESLKTKQNSLVHAWRSLSFIPTYRSKNYLCLTLNVGTSARI